MEELVHLDEVADIEGQIEQIHPVIGHLGLFRRQVLDQFRPAFRRMFELFDIDHCLWILSQIARMSLLRCLVPHAARSEEHTSELQSLMRISYAVFCLKKKNNENTY